MAVQLLAAVLIPAQVDVVALVSLSREGLEACSLTSSHG